MSEAQSFKRYQDFQDVLSKLHFICSSRSIENSDKVLKVLRERLEVFFQDAQWQNFFEDLITAPRTQGADEIQKDIYSRVVQIFYADNEFLLRTLQFLKNAPIDEDYFITLDIALDTLLLLLGRYDSPFLPAIAYGSVLMNRELQESKDSIPPPTQAKIYACNQKYIELFGNYIYNFSIESCPSKHQKQGKEIQDMTYLVSAMLPFVNQDHQEQFLEVLVNISSLHDEYYIFLANQADVAYENVEFPIQTYAYITCIIRIEQFIASLPDQLVNNDNAKKDIDDIRFFTQCILEELLCNEVKKPFGAQEDIASVCRDLLQIDHISTSEIRGIIENYMRMYLDRITDEDLAGALQVPNMVELIHSIPHNIVHDNQERLYNFIRIYFKVVGKSLYPVDRNSKHLLHFHNFLSIYKAKILQDKRLKQFLKLKVTKLIKSSDDFRYHYGIRILYDLGLHEEIINLIKKDLDRFHELSQPLELLYKQVESLRKLKRYQECLTQIEHIRKQYPQMSGDFQYQFLMAEMYVKLQTTQNKQIIFDQVLDYCQQSSLDNMRAKCFLIFCANKQPKLWDKIPSQYIEELIMNKYETTIIAAFLQDIRNAQAIIRSYQKNTHMISSES